ncbi:MAG TPA: ABC transporter ATP-binding protein [Leptospiraceae bacterium]|nr:ABC transporter ATP-binding protein [Leptospiraceae bacterium]
MGVFLRLVKYSFRYRGRFLAGLGVAFLVAVLSAVSLNSFLPFFEALGDKSAEFALPSSRAERNLMKKAILASLKDKPLHVLILIEALKYPSEDKAWTDFLGLTQPRGKEGKLDKVKSRILLALLPDKPTGVTDIESFQLRQIIYWKLRVNAYGFRPLEVIYGVLMILVPLIALRLVLQIVTVRLIAKAGYRAVRDLRSDLYRKVQELPLTFFYSQKSGVILSRMINDAEVVAAVISSNLRDAITNVFILVTHFAVLAYLNLQLLLVSLIAVPLMLSPVTLFARKVRKSTGKSQEYLADLNALLKETISGVKVIRSFAMEGYEAEQFRRANQKLYWRTFKQQFYLRASPNLVELTSAVVALGMLGLGAFFLDPTDFTGGQFMAFLVILLSLIRPVIQLSGMMAKVGQGSEAGRRIFEILDRPRDIEEARHPAVLRPLRKHLEFKNVSFQYPETDKLVLENINLHVEAGQTIALVGESGSGKSTLMDLLARFFDPTSGSIRIDGTDIRDFRIADHRSRIGIVQQENFLFHGPVRENIAYGRPEISIREIMKAARLAHAHDFIKELPGKYESMIGERGLNLSGGQRQRIAIARALLRDPEILILDEVTSALDTQSERLVQHALDRLFRNRTVFVIAHRLSTIEKADLIVVLSGGQIVDMGKHSDLMQKGGLYARLQEISRQAVPGLA